METRELFCHSEAKEKQSSDIKDPINSCLYSFLSPFLVPKSPSWNHVAIHHRDAGQSRLNAWVYNIQNRPPQH